MDFKTLLLLACVAAGTLAGPVKENLCANECNSQDDEGMFRSFKSYYFDYEVTIDSRIEGPNPSLDSSQVSIMATAAIEGLSACEMVLRLSDVAITEKAEDGTLVAPVTASFFRDSLEAHPLRFAMESNGTITSVCPEEGEEVWVLNIKRGFLSAMQTKRVSSDVALGQAGIFETDVTGTCMPTYQTEGVTLVKTQDYLMCKNRTNLNMFVDAIPVHLLAPTASPLASSLECRYEMDGQGLTLVTCMEEHSLKPFAEAETRPVTTVRTSITRKSVTHRILSSLSSEFARQTSLLYEDPNEQPNVVNTDVVGTLTDICQAMTAYEVSRMPELFQTLTKQFGQLDTDNMNMVIARIYLACPSFSSEVINMVKDALIDCDSEECAQAFSSIIQTQNSADNDFYLRKWFMKLVFHKNPTKNMINLVHRHVSGSNEVNLPAYYALSSLVHRYCLLAGFEECSIDNEILAASAVFEANLDQACQPEDEEMVKKMLMSLRAIGNMGLIQSKSLLNKCINRDSNPNKIRIAAIEAFRRAPCNQVPSDRFMRLFNMIDNDAEMRIAAFRAMVRCPSNSLLAEIADTMAQEPTHQVTCYVSSYLSNLRDSNNPLLHDDQEVIRNSALANVTGCSMDIRKYSRNLAFSRYDEETGNGISIDGDSIFSATSYLPRSFRLGMNVDLFGYGVDLFELDARTEGLQTLFEQFMEQDEGDRTTNMVEKLTHFLNGRVQRQRREGVKASAINRIQTKYDQNHGEQEQIPDASLALKILNNEVFYKDNADFQQLAEKFSPESFMRIMAMLTQTRTHEYTLNKNFKPSSVTIPTMVGMPLQVNIEGAITTVLKASGKLDVAGMAAATSRRMAVDGTFEPSAAIEVSSHMMVDAHCSRSGLAHKAKMATSLTLGGSVTYEQGMFKVKVDAPQRRQTIIDASSELFFMQQSGMRVIPEPDEATNTIDRDFIDPRFRLHISGRQPNTRVSLPASFMRSWNFQASLTPLEESLTTFDLEVGFRTDKSVLNGALQKVDKFHFLIGAPGSETIGTYSTDLTYHRSNKTLLVLAQTSVSDTYFVGSLRNETGHKHLILRATHNGRDVVLETGFDVLSLSESDVLIPIFNYTVASPVDGVLRSYYLEGNFSRQQERHAWDVSLMNQDRRVLAGIQGEVGYTPGHLLFASATTFGPFTGSVRLGYEETVEGATRSITPVFGVNTTLPSLMSVRLGGSPIVISENGATINDMYLATPSTRLIELSNFQLNKEKPITFRFDANVKETLPMSVDLQFTNSSTDGVTTSEVYLTTTSILGEYEVQMTLTQDPAEKLYNLDISLGVNADEYWALTSEFKNEIGALQYLDTTIKFQGQSFMRSKNGLRTKEYNVKTRFTPLFLLKTPSLGTYELEGSVDVSEGSVIINDLGLVGEQIIVGVSGEVNLDNELRRVSWNLVTQSAHASQRIQGSTSLNDYQVIFNTELTLLDGSDAPPNYSITIDMMNSTKEGQIFAWDAKVELNVAAHPEVSFRVDTSYELSPGHSRGNIFRLCYDGIDCTSTDKRITLGHDLTFSHDKNNSRYDHDLQATYTHPAVDKSYTLSMITQFHKGVVYHTHITVDDHDEQIFETSITVTPEVAPNNGSLVVTFTIPGLYAYSTRDTWRFTDYRDMMWLSEYTANGKTMGFEARFNMDGEMETEEGKKADIYVRYTNIRNTSYSLRDVYTIWSSGNTLRVTTLKEDSTVKMLSHQESVVEISDARIHSRSVYVAKTFFEPTYDLSFNTTMNLDPNNGNTNFQAQLRFMPNQKPVTLTVDFINHTRDAIPAGDLTTTLSLPTISITVSSEGKMERGVPSGNFNIKFLPIVGATRSYGVELAMHNASTADALSYETSLAMTGPQHTSSLTHTVNVAANVQSVLTGRWNEEQVSVALDFQHEEEMVRTDLTLTIPDHVYEFSSSQDSSQRNFTLTKDSRVLVDLKTSLNMEESDVGRSISFTLRQEMMGHVLFSSITLANISDSLSINVQVQENSRELLYVDYALTAYPGQERYDLATVSRCAYIPGYDSRMNLAYKKTMDNLELNCTVNIDATDVFSFSFTNVSGTSPFSRVTRILVTMPTNPDLRLRHMALEDACEKTEGAISHNLTAMWGNFLPTQMIGLRLTVTHNETAAGAILGVINPGRIMGFGTYYTFTFGQGFTGVKHSSTISLYGENGIIMALDTFYHNASVAYTKDHLVRITLSRANKEPIVVELALVHNRSDVVLDADVTITYSNNRLDDLTAGIEITRDVSINGHSILLTLHHMVNLIDISIMGSYSNNTNAFSLSLENYILLGGERYQPQISLALDRTNKQIVITFTGSGTYEFDGRFTNLTNEDGFIYQVNCRINDNGRQYPFAFVIDQPDREMSVLINYNPDNEGDYWEFSSGFWNDTSIYAYLHTMHDNNLINNASVAFGLSESKVLTTHINWEPSWPEDFKAAVQAKIAELVQMFARHSMNLMAKWVPLQARISDTMTDYWMDNTDVYLNAVALKTQVNSQWLLGQPMRMIQLGHIVGMLTRFNQTLHQHFPNALDEIKASYDRYQEEMDDIKMYFQGSFAAYAEHMEAGWRKFVESGAIVAEQYDPEVLAAHYQAIYEAQYAFFTTLMNQTWADLLSMEPKIIPFVKHFRAIGHNLALVRGTVQRQYEDRLDVFAPDAEYWERIGAGIIMDVQNFNATLRAAIAGWQESFEALAEQFPQPDFSQVIELGQEMNNTVQMILSDITAQLEAIRSQFLEEFPHILVETPPMRERRQAPVDPSSAMDIAAIQAAMANFNAKYSIPSIVGDLPEPALQNTMNEVEGVAEAHPSMVQARMGIVTNVLKKIFNGTYEMTKLDLANGEIMFKVFLQEFRKFTNLTSLRNLTLPYLSLINEALPDSVDTSLLEKLLAVLEDHEILSEYKTRFQEQYTASRVRAQEIAAELRDSVESRLIPYLERLGDRVVMVAGRPFFADSPSGDELSADTQSFLRELVEEFDLPGVRRLMGRAKQAVCGARNLVIRSANTVGRVARPRMWMPPYKANAMVIGAQHYVTFDQQFYDFSGKCGYLLAKDFVHENDFSAIVDYEREMEIPIRNMMFMINSTTFEIKSDGSVRVNRQLRELPFQEGDTVVIRVGETIFLKNAHGISVLCKLTHDICSMTLNGRYFDRTAGMLGNFNFEPFDDLKTPDNELQTNITSFADSWKVGKNCLQPSADDLNRVIPTSDRVVNFDPLQPENSRCASMFLDNCSPIAPCHGAVDPDAFYRMCVLDTRDLQEEELNQKMCSIAAAYKSQCWHSGQKVRMPDSCITCQLGNDTTFGVKKPIKITENEVPRKVDVVFVVEEKRCAEAIAPRLDDVVSRLAGDLRENGFEDTRFGLAAFGGPGIHNAAHQHTINHQVFNDAANEFVLGRDGLEFNGEDSSKDTFSAVKLAANYPFRAGATKHIILLLCNECRKEDNKMKFSDLSVMLNKRGIALTILMDYEFNIRKGVKSKSKAEIYGVDATSVYTSKMAGQELVKGDRTLREYVSEPATHCTLLAQETGGAIFDSSKLGDKGFNDVLVRRLVRLSDPKPCQVCRCVPDEMAAVGRSICEKCPDPFNPLGDAIRGGIRDFELRHNIPHMRFGDQTVDEDEE